MSGILKGSLIYEMNCKKKTLKTTYCLESVERKAYLKGFENIDIKRNEMGFIETNEFCKTNIHSIYAIGDILEKSMLVQVANHCE